MYDNTLHHGGKQRFFCFDDKIYMPKNGYEGLAFHF